MQYLFDDKDNKYIDFFAGVSVINCGHCNPEILKATIDQMRTLQHTTVLYLTEPIVNLAEKLSNVFPGDLIVHFFAVQDQRLMKGLFYLLDYILGKMNLFH